MSRVVWAGGSLARESVLLGEAAAAGAQVVRRCVDAAELLAAASLEPSATVVLTATVARLDGEVVARVIAGGRAVIGIAADVEERRVLEGWRVPSVIPADEDGALARALAGEPARGVWEAPASPPQPLAPLIAVWGAAGAPGRSRTALGIADEIARAGRSCCLVDADLRAPSLDLDLGVLAPASGLLVAGRQADRGRISTAELHACIRPVRERLALLSGLPTPHRGADIRPSAMGAILACARASFDAVVVDLGPCALERALPKPATVDHDDQDVSDAILASATRLVAVARDTPLGVARFLRAWRPMPMPVHVGLVCAGPARGPLAALAEAGLAAPVEVIRADARWSRAARVGATLAEVAPRSRARASYRRLAGLA